MKKLVLYIILAVLAAVSPGSAADRLTIMLDWFPNVDHMPIYVAQESGYFKFHGLKVDVITPSETSDALKLAAAGSVDLAVSYQPQTIIAADQGLKLRVVAPLVRHPLTTLLYLDSDIKSPADLSHKKIGYTVPGLMDILLKAFADINGITGYTPVNVGFTILPSLVSGKVDAIMGPFKTYETVGMAKHGHKGLYFELEKYGIPDYEELIFVCGAKILEEKQYALHRFVKAIAKGFERIKAEPEQCLKLYLTAVPQADKEIETAAFDLTRPYFAEKTGHDLRKWQDFADFALQYGLIKGPVDATELIHTWRK